MRVEVTETFNFPEDVDLDKVKHRVVEALDHAFAFESIDARIVRRRNEKVLNLPFGATLIACTSGVGQYDYLSVVLAYVWRDAPDLDEFVTWVVNTSVEPHGVGEGHYMPRSGEELEWISKAWEDFERRSRRLYQAAPRWIRWLEDHKRMDGRA